MQYIDRGENINWSQNIQTLKELKNARLMWKYMTEIANLFKSNGYGYIDNHNNSHRTLEYIVVCHKLKPDGEINVSDSIDRYTMAHPVGWVFPGGYSMVQCKNPLYVHNKNVHLTTWSTGMDIHSDIQIRLHKGEQVIQYIYDWRGTGPTPHASDTIPYELNFMLPIELFVNIILCQKELEIIDKWKEYLELKRLHKIKLIQNLWLHKYYNPNSHICIRRLSLIWRS